jgi:cytochrome c oxidase subunit 2
MWFKPIYTTEEMKKMTNNPDFEYEISCDQMCGNSHYTMRGIIKVVTKDEFILWRAKQKPAYAALTEQVAPAQPAAPATDTSKHVTTMPANSALASKK